MRRLFLASVVCSSLLLAGCEVGSDRRLVTPLSPTGPTAAPAPAPLPPPRGPYPPGTFRSIAVGEVVRFQFTADDNPCVAAGGRCRSYEITAPTAGMMEVVVTSVSGDASFVSTLDLYVVPGADDWMTGPGPRISATLRVSAGATYEIRMYSAIVPSVELELRTTLQ